MCALSFRVADITAGVSLRLRETVDPSFSEWGEERCALTLLHQWAVVQINLYSQRNQKEVSHA